MKDRTIIIVGGGIAGLTAAAELADHYNIILLEAAERLGGRIYSCHPPGFSRTIEAGSEFIHGNLKHTMRLLEMAGVDYTPVEGKMYRKESRGWVLQDEMIEGWDELLGKMKKLKEDMPLYDFLQEYFGDEKYDQLRWHAIGFTEGFDVADVKKVSAMSLYEEWSGGMEHQSRIAGGYGALVDFLEKECRQKGCSIFTGDIVKQVDWEKDTVTAYTAAGKKYYGEKMIITVPVSVLQKALEASSINFTPPLDEYVQAFQQIGFGTVIKAVIEFRSAFWKKDTGFIFSDELFPTWWTQLPDTVPLLTGWVGGTRAERMAGETDDVLLEKALLSLAAIFDLSVQEIRANLQAGKIFNWKNNEQLQGAYSYSMPGTKKALELLNTPVEETLFFCGEALNGKGEQGTVEAAIIHAKEVVKRVKSSF